MFSTRPTESSSLSASRIGIGLISRISASSSIGSRSPGASTPVTIASLNVANARSASVRWPPAGRRADSFSALGTALYPLSWLHILLQRSFGFPGRSGASRLGPGARAHRPQPVDGGERELVTTGYSLGAEQQHRRHDDSQDQIGCAVGQ